MCSTIRRTGLLEENTSSRPVKHHRKQRSPKLCLPAPEGEKMPDNINMSLPKIKASSMTVTERKKNASPGYVFLEQEIRTKEGLNTLLKAT